MDRSRFRARCLWPFCCAVLTLGLSVSGYALSIDSPAGAVIPWWEQVVRAGIALQVDMAPVESSRDGLREREQVAFRFRLFDVATGQPLTGLAPAAWLEPVAADEPFDGESCAGGAAAALAPGRPLPSLVEEGRRGTYQAVTRLGRAGRYEVFFLLPQPRIVHCFQVDVQPGP
jgi:hypothetical protein